MSCRKYSSCLGAIAFALSLEAVTFSFLALPLRAQSIEISLRFPQARDIGAPARTGGGGQRGPTACLKGNLPLTALTPTNNGVKTLLDNPTLYWYVPETRATSAEFIVVDDSGDTVYATTLPLKNTPGIVEVTLPDTVALIPGKEYTWHFAVVCYPKNRDRDEFVRGLILPTSVDILSQELLQETGKGLTPAQKEMLNPEELTKNLAQLKTNPQEAKKRLEQQAQEYSQLGVWSETLTIFTQLSKAFPNDCNLANERQELLNSVALNEIGQTFSLRGCQSN
ncbi:MAG TPA: hypothetical protein DEG17_06050 [Cyanobacteria bacterium UBA11149]|nr:hypothetical protein [Cyanobacteria bacterium UBA11367]HBE58396.1 hypothetical protein [Cyanobacteria bacterium UBA11366]HBK63622.1 hypothetical protein [Cyanobacteria bacterium UBA11166]HBR73118.1 hypothetical protein [Cyanobacteria bacterium UBA11159]HBS68028.1 hypothetical protein [Cyanobacteria bacterium UBA11153]HBW88439.1 hypothetical protein [Cyanobacteria bacterium UBA11149]HCA93451.1 hypothetical protein [Cyanobacteria bacterium UBA9226]